MDTVKPKPGYTWEQVECDYTEAYKKHYTLRDYKQEEETRQGQQLLPRPLNKTAN